MQSHLRHFLAIFLIFPLAAHGTLVTTTTDEDNGSLGGGTGISLREAVKYSSAGTTITFTPALSGQTIRLTLGEINIAKSLTIDGSGLPAQITLSGDKTGNGKSSDDSRIITIITGAVLFDSLILARGYPGSGSNRNGGAIHVNSTSTQLTIRNSTLADNEGGSDGGAIYFLGALNSPTSFLTLQNCIISGNYVGHGGGGIRMFGTLRVENTRFSANTANQGCPIYNLDGSTTVENSTFSANAAVGGGGGGGIYNYGNLAIRRSTFSGNSANQGGAIYTLSGTLTVENSTLTANTGNAIQVAGGVVSVRHATIVDNVGNLGDGIYRTSGTLTVNQSIVAGTFPGLNNFTSGNPHLAPLGNYGGLTQTMPPLPGSPAIGAGGTTTLATDQRGFPRTSKSDIGAAVYPASPDVAKFWTLDSDGDGSPYGTEQALGTDAAVVDSTHFRNLTAPVLTSSGHAVVRFGIGAAAPGTHWILSRSSDLLTFAEIYRYSGTKDTSVPGVTFLRTATGVIVTDTNPPPGGAFYRFEARLEP